METERKKIAEYLSYNKPKTPKSFFASPTNDTQANLYFGQLPYEIEQDDNDISLRVDKLHYQLHCLFEVCKLQNILNTQTNDSENSENPKVETSKIHKMMDEFIKIFPMITKNLLAKNQAAE